tara:strand:- start:46 stop:390 length:345 start_codon:yes stop_codon:yes gene_type:complete
MRIFLRENTFFLISIGAVPGSLLRWQFDNIFLVNVIGCFLLGIINGLPVGRKFKLIFGFGFCGSFTTFSGWAYQIYLLISLGSYKLFFLNSFLILLICLLAIYLGDLLARKVIN